MNHEQILFSGDRLEHLAALGENQRYLLNQFLFKFKFTQALQVRVLHSKLFQCSKLNQFEFIQKSMQVFDQFSYFSTNCLIN